MQIADKTTKITSEGLSRKSGIIFASFFSFISSADGGLAPSGVSAARMQAQASSMPIDFLLSPPEEEAIENIRSGSLKPGSLEDVVQEIAEAVKDVVDGRETSDGERPGEEKPGELGEQEHGALYTAEEASFYGAVLSIDYAELFSYMGSGVAVREFAYSQQESKAEDAGSAPGSGVDMENETIDLIVRAKKMDAMMGYGTSKLGGSAQYATASHTISVSDMEKFQLLNKMAHIFALTLIKYEMNGW